MDRSMLRTPHQSKLAQDKWKFKKDTAEWNIFPTKATILTINKSSLFKML